MWRKSVMQRCGGVMCGKDVCNMSRVCGTGYIGVTPLTAAVPHTHARQTCCMCARAHAYMYISTHACIRRVFVRAFLCLCMRVCVRVCGCCCVCVRVCVCPYTHALDVPLQALVLPLKRMMEVSSLLHSRIRRGACSKCYGFCGVWINRIKVSTAC